MQENRDFYSFILWISGIYAITRTMDNEKLENIEIALTHHEKQIQDLNDVITDQWKHIELLNRRLDKALGKIEQLEENTDASGAAPVDRPPHY